MRTLIGFALQEQARWCRALNSSLYARILESAARDADSGGIVSEILAPYANDPLESVLALRFLAAVHRIALRGDAPELAALYPSCGGSGNVTAAWNVFREVLNDHFDELRSGASLPVQTNEINRCAALLGGFLTVAGRTKLPLRIFEIGASAGLNLRWDHLRYVASNWQWGAADSALVLRGNFDSAPATGDVRVSVAQRRGCDPSPIDPATAQGRQTLESFIWPDQLGRIGQLQRACDIAARVPAIVDRADALSWLRSAPVRPAPGTATVLFHSVVMQYLPPVDRKRLEKRIAEIGMSATPAAPFAHLSMEPPEFGAHLTIWPGFPPTLLAASTAHGRQIRWLGSVNRA